MIKDLRNLVFLYIDVDEYYLLKKTYKLSVEFYCKNVNTMLTRHVKSYFSFFDNDEHRMAALTTSAMDWACYVGHLDIVIYLRKIGHSCTEYAMCLAGLNNNMNVIKYLHKSGAPLTTSFLHAACTGEHLNIVKYARKFGVPCTQRALAIVSFSGNFKIVKYLCKPSTLRTVGEIPESIDFAISWARCGHQIEIIRYLKEIKKKYIT